MKRAQKSLLLACTTSLFLTSCGWFGSDDVEKRATGQSAEKQKVAAKNEDLVDPVTEQIGTPMAERVATLGFLNKRNGITRDLELKPGQSIRIGRAIVRLRACERTAPWEITPEHGAFVQLLVNDKLATRSGQDQWKRVFSGWLFRESPSLNVIEHPIYDVWVKKCEMSFPGEEETSEEGNPTAPRIAGSANSDKKTSSAANEGAGGEEANTSSPAPVNPALANPAPAPRPPVIAETTGE